MNLRSILIIVGGIAVAALIIAAWLWLFARGSSSATQLFGQSAQNSASTTATQSSGTNVQGNVTSGSTAGEGSLSGSGTATNVPLNGEGGVGSLIASSSGGVASPGVTGSTVGAGGVVTPGGVATVPGVEWLGGTNPDSGGSSGAGSSDFVPSDINSLNGSAIGGTPIIQGSGGTAPNGDGSDIGAAVGILGATAAACVAQAAFLKTDLGGTESTVSDIAKLQTASLGGGYVLVYDLNLNNKISAGQDTSIQACLARTIAKAALQQITNSIVNWINNGFNGTPSFVQDFDQYFGSVADQAAGEFIKGTSLAFLCSPFQLQIKLAIAQAYANRNQAPSCTLSGIASNINTFLSGNFSAGGWPALLQLTTVPTNNPYGAYAYASIGLATAQQNAVNSANNNISPGGFLSVQKCDVPPTATSPGQNCKVTTPGTVIQNTLNNQLDQGNNLLAQAGVAGDFDAIINALMTQLTTRVLYSGLTSVSTGTGYANNYLTPAEQQAQTDATNLLATLQAQGNVAQQYGGVEEGAAQDVQNAQQQLSTLDTCEQGAGQMTQASTTEQSIAALESQVNTYNNNISRANSGLTAIQNLENEVLSVSTPQDVTNAQSDYQAALASGALITQTDVTNASQDRTTLQSGLAAENTATAAALAQCQPSPTASTTSQ